MEILRLIAQGLSNREIGERLFLALDTVKGHNRRIFDKLQVQRRTEAITRARELGSVVNISPYYPNHSKQHPHQHQSVYTTTPRRLYSTCVMRKQLSW